ncbi:MAG: efflux RND transporter periplasmic adaptor subunit [Gammaproteobacteria bacterium]|nr:efflux RND transporter periplasmic adaptor subunit [Gammaproteobacteria bacterium]
MNMKKLVIGLLTIALLGAGSYALYTAGTRHGLARAGHTATPGTAVAPTEVSDWSFQQGADATLRHLRDGLKAGDMDPVTGRRILYYHDPMVPGKQFPAPGKSPFMDMVMVPAYAGATGTDDSSIRVSARIRQNIGLRTAPVTEGALATEVSAVGAIAYNERDQAIVQAHALGYVEKLHVRATLDPVVKGAPLVDLYVPDWVAAQEEFLAVRRMQGTDLAPLLDGARARMRQAGMDETQIRLVEASGRVQPRLTLAAPIAGVVTELAVREGMTVAPGATLVRINGLGTVWAEAEVPESQAALLHPGAKVETESPALPGTVFTGRVQALLPQVSAETRTLKARVELANSDGRLVPGMFVQMRFKDSSGHQSLLVPTEAIIQTGKRAVVMVAEDDGNFRPVAVEPGREADDRTEIRRGLRAGQQVVVSGQFLIDSEASLRGLEAGMDSEPDTTAPRDTGDRP